MPNCELLAPAPVARDPILQLSVELFEVFANLMLEVSYEAPERTRRAVSGVVVPIPML